MIVEYQSYANFKNRTLDIKVPAINHNGTMIDKDLSRMLLVVFTIVSLTSCPKLLCICINQTVLKELLNRTI